MRPALAKFIQNPHPFLPLTQGRLRPSKIALVQTDGSFSKECVEMSRTAVILTTYDKIDHKLINSYTDHWNSMESEWCSVLNGIRYAQKKDQGSIELENDCLQVIKHLVNRRPPMKGYLASYYNSILKEAKNMEYLGIRWIPRELNRADDLFHL
jgi:ribonuclease HI